MNKKYLFGLVIILILSQLSLVSCGPGKLFGPTLTPVPTLTPTPKYYTLNDNDTSWKIRFYKSNKVEVDNKEIIAKEGDIFISIYFKCPCKSIPIIPKENEKTFLQDNIGNKYILLGSSALVGIGTNEILDLKLIFTEIPSGLSEAKLVIGDLAPVSLQLS
jgi:hypothetical protein